MLSSSWWMPCLHPRAYSGTKIHWVPLDVPGRGLSAEDVAMNTERNPCLPRVFKWGLRHQTEVGSRVWQRWFQVPRRKTNPRGGGQEVKRDFCSFRVEGEKKQQQKPNQTKQRFEIRCEQRRFWRCFCTIHWKPQWKTILWSVTRALPIGWCWSIHRDMVDYPPDSPAV